MPRKKTAKPLPEPARPASVKGAAIYLKVPERTMRRWVTNGLVPSWRLGLRRLVVDLDDVDRMRRPVPRGGAR